MGGNVVKEGARPAAVRMDHGLSVAGARITLYALMDYVAAGLSEAETREIFPRW